MSTSPAAPPAFLTVAELADLLRVSQRTAYQLVETSAVPTVRIGGQWRIPVSQLERWLAEGGDVDRKAVRP
jgi:excisionase family DNA binding protein